MRITITFTGNELTEQEIEQVISLSREYGNVEVQKRGQGNSSLDLIDYIGIKLAEGFLKGLLGEDYLKQFGKSVLDTVIREIGALNNYYHSFYKVFIKNQASNPKSISIREEFEGYNIYAVLNGSQMTEKLSKNLADAIVKTFALISSKDLIAEHPKILQLYPNFSTETWDYVFAPTTQAYGKFIDRYYDLKDNQYYFVTSAEEFIDLFNISNLDEYKFIISATFHQKEQRPQKTTTV
jgi:hypothetical protein